jgi:hypothetical protein
MKIKTVLLQIVTVLMMVSMTILVYKYPTPFNLAGLLVCEAGAVLVSIWNGQNWHILKRMGK